ncbi:sulfatase family protein [Anaerococcus lactolyticus]|uniref:Sulfatase n=1 Tax=Anaerococcus lactolyticus S7-1-13 TaxID=1284686 RepID=A0A095X5J0_9FIRM|nr:sulfatase [Anaerococcus lactolyticus]KGF05113.1 sulfatase [Anaerococcus lactolyticus S7-1-13]
MRKIKNVFYIHTHDTGRIINPYGYNVSSNNLTNFFRDSLTFQKAFSVAPTCSPSRAGLLTGSFPHQVGMLGLAQRGFVLDYTKHMAQFLKNNGFITVLSGVQHECEYYTDHSKAYKNLGYVYDLTSDSSKYSEEDLLIWDKENSKILCDWLRDYSDEKPLFVSFGLHGTHRKYPSFIDKEFVVNESVPPDNIVNNPSNREDFAKYKTSLKMTDETIGGVLNVLKEMGYFENSLIFITTDHGIAYPFSKCSLKDSGVGVMLAIHTPSNENKGKTFDGLISQLDIFPTICDFLEIEKPEYLQGKSFIDLLEKNSDIDQIVINENVYSENNFHTSYEPCRSIRSERYKYIRYFDKSYNRINFSNIDNSPAKEFLLENGLLELEKDEEQFYDLYYDKYENNNLIDSDGYQLIIDEFRQKLYEKMLETDDPLLEGELKILDNWKVNKKECIEAGSKNPEDYISLGRKKE